MKVVLFCGGLGMRIRDVDSVPKPMVMIGYRPILWHLMRYYAHYGHKDFILCLGYRADLIKRYFLQYDEWISNDFVLRGDEREPTLLHRDIADWRITFCDTGLSANIGQRLVAVRKHLEGEEMFLANYSDGLTDLPLDRFVQRFLAGGRVASFALVKPTNTFHVVSMREDDLVDDIQDVALSGLRINGGFFCFRRQIFDYIRPGEELVHEPFQRLILAKQLAAYRYDGFWTCMDTFKDRQRLEDLDAGGRAPWKVWSTPRPEAE
ncbi:MAG: glucose-1-phosphate cytidylyltransferase [Proteobacteria bacterium]|nr:MAG: glucose-1-phosphate cytidylyltransferase [Pseudomonadota bacterium]